MPMYDDNAIKIADFISPPNKPNTQPNQPDAVSKAVYIPAGSGKNVSSGKIPKAKVRIPANAPTR